MPYLNLDSDSLGGGKVDPVAFGLTNPAAPASRNLAHPRPRRTLPGVEAKEQPAPVPAVPERDKGCGPCGPKERGK